MSFELPSPLTNSPFYTPPENAFLEKAPLSANPIKQSANKINSLQSSSDDYSVRLKRPRMEEKSLSSLPQEISNPVLKSFPLYEANPLINSFQTWDSQQLNLNKLTHYPKELTSDLKNAHKNYGVKKLDYYYPSEGNYSGVNSSAIKTKKMQATLFALVTIENDRQYVIFSHPELRTSLPPYCLVERATGSQLQKVSFYCQSRKNDSATLHTLYIDPNRSIDLSVSSFEKPSDEMDVKTAASLLMQLKNTRESSL